VVYFTDMTRRDARIIPLGSFSEIMLPHVYGLALKARSALTAEEADLIGPLLRERVADPFSFLREQFEMAWKEAKPGSKIDFLTTRHRAAISILAAHDVEEGGWWARFTRAHKETIVLKLSDAVDREFADLLAKYGHKAVPDVPKRELIEVDHELVAA
jgi:hypothetical protein